MSDQAPAIASVSPVSKSIGAAEVAAGGGAGGVLVYAINAFVVDPRMQNLLLYIVPAASVAVTSGYTTAVSRLQRWWEEKDAEKKRRALLTRAQGGLAEAKQQLASIESDENATADHKQKARERVQAFERAVLALHAKGVVEIDSST